MDLTGGRNLAHVPGMNATQRRSSASDDYPERKSSVGVGGVGSQRNNSNFEKNSGGNGRKLEEILQDPSASWSEIREALKAQGRAMSACTNAGVIRAIATATAAANDANEVNCEGGAGVNSNEGDYGGDGVDPEQQMQELQLQRLQRRRWWVDKNHQQYISNKGLSLNDDTHSDEDSESGEKDEEKDPAKINIPPQSILKTASNIDDDSIDGSEIGEVVQHRVQNRRKANIHRDLQMKSFTNDEGDHTQERFIHMQSGNSENENGTLNSIKSNVANNTNSSSADEVLVVNVPILGLTIEEIADETIGVSAKDAMDKNIDSNKSKNCASCSGSRQQRRRSRRSFKVLNSSSKRFSINSIVSEDDLQSIAASVNMMDFGVDFNLDESDCSRDLINQLRESVSTNHSSLSGGFMGWNHDEESLRASGQGGNNLASSMIKNFSITNLKGMLAKKGDKQEDDVESGGRQSQDDCDKSNASLSHLVDSFGFLDWDHSKAAAGARRISQGGVDFMRDKVQSEIDVYDRLSHPKELKNGRVASDSDSGTPVIHRPRPFQGVATSNDINQMENYERIAKVGKEEALSRGRSKNAAENRHWNIDDYDKPEDDVSRQQPKNPLHFLTKTIKRLSVASENSADDPPQSSIVNGVDNIFWKRSSSNYISSQNNMDVNKRSPNTATEIKMDDVKQALLNVRKSAGADKKLSSVESGSSCERVTRRLSTIECENPSERMEREMSNGSSSGDPQPSANSSVKHKKGPNRRQTLIGLPTPFLGGAMPSSENDACEKPCGHVWAREINCSSAEAGATIWINRKDGGMDIEEECRKLYQKNSSKEESKKKEKIGFIRRVSMVAGERPNLSRPSNIE